MYDIFIVSLRYSDPLRRTKRRIYMKQINEQIIELCQKLGIKTLKDLQEFKQDYNITQYNDNIILLYTLQYHDSIIARIQQLKKAGK